MFALLIRRLTLLAFAAHAALGCCWHHAHAVEGATHGQHGLHAGPVLDLHRCSAHAKTTAPVLSTARAMRVDAPPCEDSHECQEVRCSFVPTAAKPLGTDLFPAAAEFSIAGPVRLAVKPADVAHTAGDRESDIRVLSSAQCCAHLQSWQI